MEQLVGPTLQNQQGTVSTSSALAGADCIGLYFSAHWCPPCRGFTPQLASIYSNLKRAGKNFEVIFISSDREEGSFNEYFQTMPWLAMPYGALPDYQGALSQKYGVRGIPCLILLDRQGNLLDQDGRSAVVDDPSGASWLPKPVVAHFAGEGHSLGGPTGHAGGAAAIQELRGALAEARAAGASRQEIQGIMDHIARLEGWGSPMGAGWVPPAAPTVQAPPAAPGAYRPEGLSDDEALQMALQASMADVAPPPPPPPPPPPRQSPKQDEMEDALEADLEMVRTDSFKDHFHKVAHKIRDGGSKVAVATCLETLRTLITNLRTGNEKFQSLRKENKGLQTRVFAVTGGAEYLGLVGFRNQVIEYKEFMVCEQVDQFACDTALQVLDYHIQDAKYVAVKAKQETVQGSRSAEDERRAAIRRRIANDKRERAQRQMTASKSEWKGFKAGERKTATQLGADGNADGAGGG